MPRYMTVTEYRNTYFTAKSRPAQKTVCRWIRTGKLPAIKRGKQYFIDTTKIQDSTGDPLVDKVLRAN